MYEDLILRKTPKWFKPKCAVDYFQDSIVQKMILWATPEFIQFSLGFILTVYQIYRHELPVIHLQNVFSEPVS